MADLPLVTHWIDGKPFDGSSGRTGDVFDPALGQVTKRVAFASADDVDAAVSAATAAFAQWRSSSLAERTKVLFRFRELLQLRADDLAAIITAEHGKNLGDALGEVNRGLEVVEFACGIPHLLKGGFSEGVSTRVDVYSIRQPLGVAAIISPFNFPAMVPCWFFPILPDRDRVGERGDREAEREGSVGRELAGRAVGRGGPPARRVQRRAR
jgi:malonate-semialdehyde dehydrogenase (acetylating)/methylmalonate-semialdehyde dehydrogenase